MCNRDYICICYSLLNDFVSYVFYLINAFKIIYFPNFPIDLAAKQIQGLVGLRIGPHFMNIMQPNERIKIKNALMTFSIVNAR